LLKSRNSSSVAPPSSPAERRKAEQLAAQATSLEGLIGSIESEIASARDAAAAAKAEEENRRLMSEAQRTEARELANSTTPDKNRIAPAYAFSDLQKKLALPVAGSILRKFGDADGTGHSLQGMMLETNAGALVTAPADGLIVYAGAFRSYGQMIILNAGDGYHIVLSGLEDVNSAAGPIRRRWRTAWHVMGAQKSGQCDCIGAGNERPTLYIEFQERR
jgi:septal ring factor EnvC (AmiA/AmiB activator)